MQLLSKAYLIFLLICLYGCAYVKKCPDSISLTPINISYSSMTNFQTYSTDGIKFSLTWYLPLDNKNVCSDLSELYIKMLEEQRRIRSRYEKQKRFSM